MPPDTLAPATPSAAPASAPSLQVDAPPVRLALLDRRIWRDAGFAWLAQHLVFLIPIAITIALASLTRPVGILLLQVLLTVTILQWGWVA
jgi:hypothetical protein